MRQLRGLWRLLVIVGVILLFAAGCDALPTWAGTILRTPTLPPTEPPPPDPLPTEPVEPTSTPLAPDFDNVILWLPPAFDPSADSPASALLQDRLDTFAAANSVTIEVRIKAPDGAAGMIEALTAAKAAALRAVPSLTLLTRSELETAALKGLLAPLETPVDDAETLYPFARDLGAIQDQRYGVAVAGDALAFIYRPAKAIAEIGSWDDIEEGRMPVLFAGSSSQPLFTLGLYESTGGQLVDEDDRPILQSDAFLPVLRFISQVSNKGVFSPSVVQFENEIDVWNAYLNGSADGVVSWSSFYLSDMPADSQITRLPSYQGRDFSYGTGWVWTVTDPFPQRREETLALLAWLSDPQFLAAWTEEMGLLPPSPAILNSWKDVSLRTNLDQLCRITQLRPSNDQLAVLGPVIRDAQIQTIRQELSPETAAQNAVSRLGNPSVP